MFKASYEITNSVNDDERKVVKYFNTEEEGEDFLADAEDDVNEWNRPENTPSGGRMSTRYISCNLIKVTDSTILDGLTMGNLREIIASVARTTPPAVYGGNGLVT